MLKPRLWDSRRIPGNVLVVAGWELRRLTASRGTWLVAALALLSCLAVAGLKHSWGRPVVDGVSGETVLILGTTAVGVPYLMIAGLFVLLGPLLPFVASEAIAQDYRQRTHELLMATPVSTWGYVWGRYLAALLVSVGLDGLLLVSVFAVGLLLHMQDPTYPLPDPLLVCGVWLIAIVPGTFVISSLSFALGACVPRVAGFVKIVPIAGWISLVFLADVLDHGGTWFTYWNPTSYGIVRVNVDRFLDAYRAGVAGMPDAADRLSVELALQQQTLPDLGPWIAPHVVLVIASLALIGWTAARFGRFQEVLG